MSAGTVTVEERCGLCDGGRVIEMVHVVKGLDDSGV